MNVSYLTKKTLSGSGDQWEFVGSLNGTLLEDLYMDISTEALGSPSPGAAESGTPPKPVILRKIHAKREIIEMPVKFQAEKSNGRWAVSRLESEPPLTALGTPASRYTVNALLQGTSQANAAIHAYQSAISKPKPSVKKEVKAPESPVIEKPAKVVEKPTASEAPKPDKEQSLAKLLTACTSGALYEGTLRERDGLHAVILNFGRVERDGDFVTADLREKNSAFKRRDLSGQVRQNPKIPQNFELILMGTDSSMPKTLSNKSAQAVQYRTSFILTLDEEGNLVGNYDSKTLTAGQTSSITLPSPLSSNAVYQIRFTRSSSHF
ncbi:MAG: hypothetical protein ACOYMV_02580 [Verrucomicrobiia bacterium]